MSTFLLDALDVALAEAAPVLVPPERIPALRETVSHLAPIMPAGIEFRLGSGGPIHVQQTITTANGLSGIAARHLAARLASTAPESDRIARLLVAWDDPTTAWRESVRDISLVVGLDAAPHQATVLVGLASGRSREGVATVVASALATLLPDLAPAVLGTFRRCVESSPESGVISRVGAMLAHSGPTLTIAVDRVPVDGIAHYLAAIGWLGPVSRVEALVERCLPLIDSVTLVLDVGSAVEPRLGLQYTILGQPKTQPRWAAFLEHLIGLGCCTPPEREALLAWPRAIIPPASRARWPAALIADDIARPADHLSGIAVGLNHVRLEVADAVPLRATVSVSFHPGPLDGNGDIVHASAGPEPAARPAPRVSSNRSGALDDAIDGALEFLLSHRAQSGLWRDFPTNTGGTDHWLSCVVGAILAEDPRPQIRREAAATWRILTTQASASGGWGWCVVAPPDADSTAWGLRLAHGVGAGDSGPAHRAVEFIHRHSSPSGGLRPYLPDAFPRQTPEAVQGWTLVHDCVTAGAAVLPGAAGEGPRRHLRGTQRADGSWRAYWWNDDSYSTALAAEGLALRGETADGPRIEAAVGWATRRVNDDGAVTATTRKVSSPFVAAWVLGTLALGNENRAARAALQRTAAWLVGAQQLDGSWPSLAHMFTPPRHALDPREYPEERIIFRDERRIFTTATVLKGLLAAQRALRS